MPPEKEMEIVIWCARRVALGDGIPIGDATFDRFVMDHAAEIADVAAALTPRD
jgi:hypothetical protein